MTGRIKWSWMIPFALWALLAGETLPVLLDRAATWWYGQLFLIAVVGAACATRASSETSRTSAVLLHLGVVVVCFHLLWGPLYFRSPAIETRVSEYPSLRPAPGAFVEARWVLQVWSNETRDEVFAIARRSDVSDARGRVTLRGWWPRPRPPFLYFIDLDPEIRVRAPDGLVTTEDNSYHQSVHPRRHQFSSRRFSEWSRHDLWLYTAARGARAQRGVDLRVVD